MSIASTNPAAFPLWSEEPATRPDRRKIRARIGGLHCSLCTGTIEKALGRLAGVDKVAVSLVLFVGAVAIRSGRPSRRPILNLSSRSGGSA
jgi:hypothetical protein